MREPQEGKKHKNKIFIIAEAGVNHNGSVDMAKQLIDIAKESGADAIKFQTFIAEKLATEQAEQASYQKRNMKTSSSQVEMLKKLEISFDDFKVLKEKFIEHKIDFVLGRANWLGKLNIFDSFFKDSKRKFSEASACSLASNCANNFLFFFTFSAIAAELFSSSASYEAFKLS